MGQKLLPVGEYVDHLKSFEKEPITRDRVLQFCLETAVEPGTLVGALRNAVAAARA